MTEVHSGYVVVLQEDLRDDDGEATLNALRMVKGVLSVAPVVASQVPAWIIKDRIVTELRRELYDLATKLGKV